WQATEFVPGHALDEHIERLDERRLSHAEGRPSRTFPLRAVLQLFIRVCELVDAAHRAGVIHRDLKPANIIVDLDGIPHLLDFGVAKAPNVCNPALATASDQFLGSVAYASPEQVEARPGYVDVRSDVYSLGVILYELVTGSFPYKVDGPIAQTFDAIRHTDP